MLTFEAGHGDVAFAFANQFNAFPTKFPKNRNRECHRLNRELHVA